MRPYKNLPSYVENMILRLEFDIYDIITNAKIAFLAPIDIITTQGTDPEEIYANAFASTLLVPIQLLIEQIKITKNINTIAEVFQVSPSVIKYRIQRFCLENVEDNV